MSVCINIVINIILLFYAFVKLMDENSILYYTLRMMCDYFKIYCIWVKWVVFIQLLFETIRYCSTKYGEIAFYLLNFLLGEVLTLSTVMEI